MPCEHHGEIERVIGHLEEGQIRTDRELSEFRSEVRRHFDMLPGRVADAVRSKRDSGSGKPKDDGASSEYRKLWITLLLIVIAGIFGGGGYAILGQGTNPVTPQITQVSPK